MCNIDLETFFISNHSNNKSKIFKPSITQLPFSIKEIEMENFQDRYVQSSSKEESTNKNHWFFLKKRVCT